MPDFGNPFSGLKNDRKLDKEELIRAIRFLIAAEYEAVQLYTQLADSITDPHVDKVLRDIAEEEVVHAGEFLRLLIHLRPEEFKSYLEGIKETEDMIKKAQYSTEGNVLYWEVSGRKKYPVGVFTSETNLFRTIMPQKKAEQNPLQKLMDLLHESDDLMMKIEREIKDTEGKRLFNEANKHLDEAFKTLNKLKPRLTLANIIRTVAYEIKNSSE